MAPGETFSGMGFVWEGRQDHRDTERTHLLRPVSCIRLHSPFKPLKGYDRYGPRVYLRQADGATPALRSLHRHLADDDGPIRQVRRDELAPRLQGTGIKLVSPDMVSMGLTKAWLPRCSGLWTQSIPSKGLLVRTSRSSNPRGRLWLFSPQGTHTPRMSRVLVHTPCHRGWRP